MTHDLKTLIEKYPRAAKACGIDRLWAECKRLRAELEAKR